MGLVEESTINEIGNFFTAPKSKDYAYMYLEAGAYYYAIGVLLMNIRIRGVSILLGGLSKVISSEGRSVWT